MKKLILQVFGASLIIMFFNHCSNKPCDNSIVCALPEGTVIAKEENNEFRWVMNKEILKSDIMQVALQLQKFNPPCSDSLVFQSIEIVKDGADYLLEGKCLLSKDKSLSVYIGLKKDSKNQLVVSLPKNESGNKTIEGCLGDKCSSCKLKKGSGCSCNTEGHCNHIIIEVSLLPF